MAAAEFDSAGFVAHVRAYAESIPTSERRVVAIAGPPASGKSTLAAQLVDTLNAKPSVRGLDRLVELKAAGHLEDESSDDILRAVTARLMSRQPAYRCNHCGFSGHTHHWQCPSCRNWSTTKKIHGVLGE